MTIKTPIFTVTQITKGIRELLENSLAPCWIEGEISNLTYHSSGHTYFSLKDENSQIKTVIWKSYRNNFTFKPADGLKVLAYGAVKVYEKGGYYQFSVFNMQPKGIGDLQLAFEQLKEKLQKEGLFDLERKKPVPSDAQRIGVVTSATGAALHDIVSVIKRRNRGALVILYSVKVQGEGAATEIARAIKDFNEYGKVEVLIVGRGGGSAEDLWAFNEEVVAYAIAGSKIPIVSAVGHEIDFTIADFVADLRAPTPSAAAELVVGDSSEKAITLNNLYERLNLTFDSFIGGLRHNLSQLISTLRYLDPLQKLSQYAQRVDELINSLNILSYHILERDKSRLSILAGKLESLSPLAVFNRGYSITKSKDGKIIRHEADVKSGDEITTTLNKGLIVSIVK